MGEPIRTICVTGCLGFMGAHFTRAALKRGWRVWGIDLMTYAARAEWLAEFRKAPTFEFQQADIAALDHLFEVDAIFNFAAETHVDNSIVDATRFLRSNIMGVQNLLELIRAKRHYEMPALFQISTDEVYGDIKDGKHKTTSPLRPSNPYSASKASADMLILAWHRTHGVPYCIVRPTNNYGIGQYPEKLIPKSIKYLSLGKPIPLHGDGSFIRNWLHVEDMAEALFAIFEKGTMNQVYNIAGNHEIPNREIIRQIIKCYFGKPRPLENHVKFHYVRQGEDVRYSLDDSSTRVLGWKNRRKFNAEIRKIVAYYKNKVVW